MADSVTYLDSFKQRVLMIVNAIPYGKVMTYGEVARQAGSSRAARQVGHILKNLPDHSKLPWFRVVNRSGKIALTGDSYQRQYELLVAEGVIFDKNNKIDLQSFGHFN